MTTKHLSASCAALAVCLVAAPALAQEPDAQAIVDLQFKIGGDHPKVRASGAKGTCVKGTWAPAADAAGLSKAAPLVKESPVLGRFSMGGSNPNISDKTKPVTRGFSLRFDDKDGDLVLVFISAPVFGVRTPEQLLAGIQARLPGADGKPDADKVKTFVDANPETTRQSAWLNARPVPASFASADYWAVHAYTLTNAKGEAKVAKLKAVPAGGAVGLSDAELAAKPASFYADELKERLAKGPAAFDILAIMAEPGDSTTDATATWPEDQRKSAKLGTVAISALEDAATCDAQTFDPVVNVPDGIAGPTDDPTFAVRSPTYAISISRRQN